MEDLGSHTEAARSHSSLAMQNIEKEMALPPHVRARIVEELSRAMARAEAAQQHARFLERAIEITPDETRDFDSLAAANDELHRRLCELQTKHDEIAGSAAWRVGRRLRHSAQKQPRLARILRRSIKLLYWIVTFRLWSNIRRRQRTQTSIALLEKSPLFDGAWYLRHYADLLSPDTDPVRHYLWVGAEMGLDPHPLFSSTWYRSKLTVETAVNPLIHYISRHGRGTPDPHPLFDTDYYLKQRQGRIAPGMTPLEDFLVSDKAERVTPNPVFTATLYAEEYLESFDTPPNALVHYAAEGEKAGFWPHPLFDPVWYRHEHSGSARWGAFAHYLREGGREAKVACSEQMKRLGAGLSLPFRVTFPEVAGPEVSVIVPIFGHAYDTWRCLASVSLATHGVTFEVIVADDRPSRPVAPLLDVSGATMIINNENQGFLGNCNSAARRAQGRELVFLNNDTTVGKNWLAPMMAVMRSDSRVGMVGCKLLNSDGSVQEAGGIIYSTGWGDPFGKNDLRPERGRYNYVRDVDVVTGACFLVRRDVFEAHGGFDGRFAPAFYEEFDLATSMRNAGYRIVYQPASVVYHYGSASYGTEVRDRQTLKNHRVFCKKWATLLSRQPAPDDPSFLVRERPSARGVILVIDDKVPEYDKHAGAVTLFQYLGLLREMGLRVVYAPHNGLPLEPYTSALQQRGIEVLYKPDTLHDWLKENGTFIDFIWTARPDVTHPILPWLKRYTGAKILYYTHDLHYLRERRRYELEGSVWALQESQRLKPIELGIFREVDCVMTPSREEAGDILAEVPEANVAVIPPYLFGETMVSDAAEGFGDRKDVLFIGGFDHTPNVDAALWLVTEIMPLIWREKPNTVLWIVGNVPPENVRALASDKVQVTGFVPDLDPYLTRARVSLNPLRYGAGVKGKIVTSLQAGIPVVTTPCGNEGIQLQNGRDALIGETAEELAAATLRLLSDVEMCARLIRSGADVVRTRFSKELARRDLRQLFGDALCPVCGARPRQTKRRMSLEWREETHCIACGALNRSAALAQVLISPWNRYGINILEDAFVYLRENRIHEFGHTGPIGRRLGVLEGFSCSDYFDDTERNGASSVNGVAHENIQDLSFASNTMNLMFSQDVMEHVADPWLGFREIYRVLTAGGRYVFTAPANLAMPSTIVRAVLEDGTIRHVETPQYHGDPRREEGALVFTDFGADIISRLQEIGFIVRIHEVGMPEGRGETVRVFEAIKPQD